MDMSLVDTLGSQLEQWLDAANQLPGTVAFVAGAFSWFVIEQIIRRLAGIMRTALMLGLIAAAGVSLVALTNFIVNDGDISGFDTLLPSNEVPADIQ